jgi:hypothetical protein
MFQRQQVVIDVPTHPDFESGIGDDLVEETGVEPAQLILYRQDSP